MLTLTILTEWSSAIRSSTGRDGVARAAPLRPEVDDHLARRGEDLLLEGRFGCFELPSTSFRGFYCTTHGGAASSSRLELRVMFDPLPPVPDSNALELEVLERWEREGTFEQLRDRNRGGPPWSFIDGPVTANKALAVHTAWGRTLKDVFQRYKALRGFDQRYQNGFDCQGLWIEVGVERQLGLNSKREIEEFGLEEFARRCREVVVRSAEELTRGEQAARPVDGLGQRLLHLQRHEHRVHLAVPEDRQRAWLAVHRPPCDRVVPALRHVALRSTS